MPETELRKTIHHELDPFQVLEKMRAQDEIPLERFRAVTDAIRDVVRGLDGLQWATYRTVCDGCCIG